MHSNTGFGSVKVMFFVLKLIHLYIHDSVGMCRMHLFWNLNKKVASLNTTDGQVRKHGAQMRIFSSTGFILTLLCSSNNKSSLKQL